MTVRLRARGRKLGGAFADGLLSIVAGATLGFGAAQLQGIPSLVGVLFAAALAGEWLLVRLKPFGELTLRPVAAFVALWTVGLGGYLVAGVAPVVLVRTLTARATLYGSLSFAGRDAVALWGGLFTFWATGDVYHGFDHRNGEDLRGLLLQTMSIAAYWMLHVLLQAATLASTEGVRFRSAVRYLAIRSGPHVVVLSLAAVGLGIVASKFGLLVLAIAMFVLVEAYYPWKLLGEQTDALFTSLQVLAQAVDLKDPYTSGHSQRVAQYAVRLARMLDLPEDEVERIRVGALMHDIGKIGIRSRILRKPGKLTDDERALMNKHSAISADIIAPLEVLGESAEMVRRHHEHWDGSGYPEGIRADTIPLGARIILVADALDALTTDRPYRRGVPMEEAVRVIKAHAGTQFDPTVVTALERLYRKFHGELHE
jgi:putative nucleotidyltransferase with HDIG domain